MKKATKRRAWSTADVRTLKTLARSLEGGRVQETSQKGSNVPKEGRDKKHLVLVCRLTRAFSR